MTIFQEHQLIIDAGGPGSGEYEHHSRFNTQQRYQKLAAKEASLRKLGLHKEADLFKSKLQQLRPQSRDNLKEAFKKAATQNTTVGSDLAKMHDALQDKGYTSVANSDKNKMEYRANSPEGSHTITVDKTTQQWKHYYPTDDEDGMPIRRSGIGYTALANHLK